jgi:8-oxo-dGTP pyrophosphatase MutT (NUDIX family)
MLVVRTRRHPGVWQPIGGGIKVGESPVEAAVREIVEETGWIIESAGLTKVLELPMDAHAGTLFFYTARAPEHEPVIDYDELVEARWAAAGELAKLPAFAAARTFYQTWACL